MQLASIRRHFPQIDEGLHFAFGVEIWGSNRSGMSDFLFEQADGFKFPPMSHEKGMCYVSRIYAR